MEKKTLQSKTKFKQYLFTNSALQKALEGKLQPEDVNNHTQENTRNKQSLTRKSKKEKWKHKALDENNRNQKQTLHIDMSQLQWSQFLNKKTQTNRMDVKIDPSFCCAKKHNLKLRIHITAR